MSFIRRYSMRHHKSRLIYSDRITRNIKNRDDKLSLEEDRVQNVSEKVELEERYFKQHTGS